MLGTRRDSHYQVWAPLHAGFHEKATTPGAGTLQDMHRTARFDLLTPL
jgi:hypothetical protein